jgi:hypothetical protein
MGPTTLDQVFICSPIYEPKTHLVFFLFCVSCLCSGGGAEGIQAPTYRTISGSINQPPLCDIDRVYNIRKAYV